MFFTNLKKLKIWWKKLKIWWKINICYQIQLLKIFITNVDSDHQNILIFILEKMMRSKAQELFFFFILKRKSYLQITLKTRIFFGICSYWSMFQLFGYCFQRKRIFLNPRFFQHLCAINVLRACRRYLKLIPHITFLLS